MTRVVLAAVLVLVAVAAADSLRSKGKTYVVANAADATPATQIRSASSGYEADGPVTRKRVLLHGKEYLSAEAVDTAFPSPDRGQPFDISHLATAPDGTLALAVYRFPAKQPALAAVELWREHELVGTFRVPPGAFAGGLGFAEGGRLVATVLEGGHNVLLFTRSGKWVGSTSATSG